MVFKRSYLDHEDFRIDIPYLINQNRILSEKEFHISLPEMPYEEYFNTFLKRKIADLFHEHRNSEWFKNRYLKQEKSIEITKENLNCVIVARNISPTENTLNSLTNLDKIKIFLTSQNSKAKNFSIDLFIIPNLKFSVDSIIDSLTELNITGAQQIDLSNVPFKSMIFCTSAQLKKIFTLFCNLYNLDENAVLEEFSNSGLTPLLKYLEILQKKFNFDPSSCKQFDNNIALLDHYNQFESCDISERNLEILGYSAIYKNVLLSENLQQDKMYTETLQKNFKCNKCEKIFETEEFITQHIQKKHQEINCSFSREDPEMNHFLENLDCFFLSLGLGIEDSTVPTFFESNCVKNSVVYDMPSIFSGEF